jgi:hypothetical protein
MHPNADMPHRGAVLIDLVLILAFLFMALALAESVLFAHQAHVRDVARHDDLHTIQVALETFKNKNGAYPVAAGWRGTCTTWGGYPAIGVDAWVRGLTPDILTTLPTDPAPREPAQCYVYHSDGTDYKLMAYHTMEQLPEGNRCAATCSLSANPWCAADTANTYAVYSPGAACW